MIRQEGVKKFTVNKKATVRDVLKAINRNKEGIALVMDDKSRLLGTITDGDIRRFILKNGNVSLRCVDVMNTSYVYAKKDSPEEIKQLMSEHRIRHIPLINNEKRLVKFYVSDKIYDTGKGITAVIMAGGEGKRTREISRTIPKPLLKIGNRPILEEVMMNLKKHGISQIYLSLNYKAKVFKDYFKDGARLGVNVKYLEEKKKLGTAGSLSLLPKDISSDTIIVMNADVLTSTNFANLIRFHKDHRLLMCVASKEYAIDIPFGVFDVISGHLMGIKEKPSERFFCNAGIYVLDRDILKFIPKNKRYDMTDLIKLLIQKSLPIGVFPLYEYWIDIGNSSDYYKAGQEYGMMFKRKSYE